MTALSTVFILFVMAEQNELIKRTFIEMMKDIGTSIPGYILAFDPDTQLAQVQIGIERKARGGDKFVPAPLVECPVYFPGGAGGCVEFAIEPEDEGIVLFSQRCIDAWRETGGVATNPVMRFHDFSDAYFLPGLRSKPNALSDFQNDGIRMRNVDASAYVWLKSDGSVEIQSTTLTHNGVNIGADHTHPYSWTDGPGSDNTGAPS